jgi:WD40-like Beta Propeller Repeat
MIQENSTRCASPARSPSGFKPESARWLHVVLLVVGVAAWMIFILACIGGPAWSPDGSQILFAYRDVENSRTAVALYDRATRTTTTIFAQPAAKEGELALEPQWQKDGTRALIAVYQPVPESSDGSCEVISIPVKSSMPLRAYAVGTTEGCAGPYLQLDGKVYFGGKDLRWIDLVTGEIGSKDVPDGVGSISEHDGQLFYLREVSRSAGNAEDKKSVEQGTEFGRIDLKELTLKPAFSLWESDTTALGLREHLSPVFWETSGLRMAVIGEGDHSDQILFLEEGKGIARALAPDLGVKDFRLGNLVWSHDGKTLYASAITKEEEEGIHQYWLAEIPVAGAPGRLTKIASIPTEMNDEEFKGYFRVSMQVSLSPDGTLIAATPAVLGKSTLAERDRAFFLIDVRDPARPITRIPIPNLSAAARSVEKTNQ